MPLSSPRFIIKPLRGTYAALLANVADIEDGEICYAIDQDQHYQNESGTLVAVAASKSQGALADTAVQPADNISTLTNDAGYLPVNLSNVQANDLVQFNGAEWVNTSAPAADISGNSIDDLADVDTTTAAPTLDQALVWNNTNWVPGSVATLDAVRLDAEDKTLSYTSGNLTGVSGTEVQVSISYNVNGSVNTVAKTSNGTTVTKTFGYDGNGNLTSITVS
jgi:YD repeat-containing protein